MGSNGFKMVGIIWKLCVSLNRLQSGEIVRNISDFVRTIISKGT